MLEGRQESWVCPGTARVRRQWPFPWPGGFYWLSPVVPLVASQPFFSVLPRCWGPPVPAHCPERPDPGAQQRVAVDQARGGGGQRLLPLQGQQRRGRGRQQVHVPHGQK